MSLDHANLPTRRTDAVVVVPAEKHTIFDIRRAPSPPGDDVVDLAPSRGYRAARDDACCVASADRFALSRCEEALFEAVLQDLPVFADEDRLKTASSDELFDRLE